MMIEQKNQDLRLLVVEDDRSLREAIVDTLCLDGYIVDEANSAEEALAQLQQFNQYQLIISDVNMGKMSGHDLLRHVKQNYPHVPMLLITAFASIQDSVTAMKEGAIDYLVKPFDPAVLQSTVKRFTGNRIPSIDEPIAEAPSSQALLSLAKRVAQSDSTVL